MENQDLPVQLEARTVLSIRMREMCLGTRSWRDYFRPRERTGFQGQKNRARTYRDSLLSKVIFSTRPLRFRIAIFLFDFLVLHTELVPFVS